MLGVGRRAAWLRRLRATRALALTLAVAGIGHLQPPAAADASERQAPLSYHATVVNGRITGSGFQIEDGIGVTNAHVLGRAKPGSELLVDIGDGPGKQRWRVRVLAVSPVMDLALITLPAGLLPVAPHLDAPLARGTSVTAAGVVAERDGPGRRMELPGRIVSDIVRIDPFGRGLVAHMPGIRRGFSGGPVFDHQGRLVGMVAALRPDPAGMRSAAGEPMEGVEAFVLAAPAVRAEAARLLKGLSAR